MVMFMIEYNQEKEVALLRRIFELAAGNVRMFSEGRCVCRILHPCPTTARHFVSMSFNITTYKITC